MVVCGQSAWAAGPKARRRATCSRPGGSCQPCTGSPSMPFFSTALKIGAAVIEPSDSFIGLLSLLPVQTPTASCGV